MTNTLKVNNKQMDIIADEDFLLDLFGDNLSIFTENDFAEYVDEFDEDDVYFIIDFNENVLLVLCDETSSYNITQDIAEALQI